MPGIDQTLSFHPLRIAVLTISDTRTEETDSSGDLLVSRITGSGHQLAGRAIVSDIIDKIRGQLTVWIDDPQIEIVITTGGRGLRRAISRQKRLSRF